MAIRRIHPYVETDDLDASRSFYTEVFGLQVAMETPVIGLQAPELTSSQVIVCPRGFATPQPDFGIDVGEPDAVDQAARRRPGPRLARRLPAHRRTVGRPTVLRRGPRRPHHQRPRTPPSILNGIPVTLPFDDPRARRRGAARASTGVRSSILC